MPIFGALHVQADMHSQVCRDARKIIFYAYQNPVFFTFLYCNFTIQIILIIYKNFYIKLIKE